MHNNSKVVSAILMGLLAIIMVAIGTIPLILRDVHRTVFLSDGTVSDSVDIPGEYRFVFSEGVYTYNILFDVDNNNIYISKAQDDYTLSHVETYECHLGNEFYDSFYRDGILSKKDRCRDFYKSFSTAYKQNNYDYIREFISNITYAADCEHNSYNPDINLIEDIRNSGTVSKVKDTNKDKTEEIPEDKHENLIKRVLIDIEDANTYTERFCIDFLYRDDYAPGPCPCIRLFSGDIGQNKRDFRAPIYSTALFTTANNVREINCKHYYDEYPEQPFYVYEDVYNVPEDVFEKILDFYSSETDEEKIEDKTRALYDLITCGYYGWSRDKKITISEYIKEDDCDPDAVGAYEMNYVYCTEYIVEELNNIFEDCSANKNASEHLINNEEDPIYPSGYDIEEKPVIYLYGYDNEEVSVKLDYNGTLTTTYPKYDMNKGWNVTAQKDGTLVGNDKKTYSYLYWEGNSNIVYDFAEGFCIKGSETASFLEKQLENLGLNRKEANEFIVYWLPRMENNEYNVISFQTKAYEEAVKLEVNPAPDKMIRVFMAWYPSSEFVGIKEQKFDYAFVRDDKKILVEWGGALVDPDTTKYYEVK